MPEESRFCCFQSIDPGSYLYKDIKPSAHFLCDDDDEEVLGAIPYREVPARKREALVGGRGSELICWLFLRS